MSITDDKLIAGNVEVAFIDEFSVNGRAHKKYGWYPIGSWSLFLDRTDFFNSKLMVCISQRCCNPVFSKYDAF